MIDLGVLAFYCGTICGPMGVDQRLWRSVHNDVPVHFAVVVLF